MTRFTRLAAVLLLVASSAAEAQHYQLVVGRSDTPRMLILDFSPCIPAEGSGCGGFLTREFDPSGELSNRIEPSHNTQVSAPNGDGGIRIVGDTIVVTTRGTGKQAVLGRQIFDPGRTPIAVAIAPDSRYAFAVLVSKRADVKAQVRMFDLATRTAVASLLIDGVPSGISVGR